MVDQLQYSKIVKYLKKHGDVMLSGVFCDNWKWMTYARSLIGHTTISGEWLDYHKDHPKIYEPPSVSKESTFSECIDALIRSKDDKIIMCITLWDGDSYDGSRIREKCLFEIALPTNIELHNDILSVLTRHSEKIAEQQIKKAEENRLARLVKNRAKKLLPL